MNNTPYLTPDPEGYRHSARVCRRIAKRVNDAELARRLRAFANQLEAAA